MNRFKKLEPVNIRGTCVVDGCTRLQKSNGKGGFRPICNFHADRRKTRFVHRLFKKDHCEICGFIPEHECQLDVDHIDGNHKNNEQENLMTLCANCHRLKTFLNRDFDNPLF